MDARLYPLLTYVFVMTFTPGPNNISASALGMRHGYRGTLPFIIGMTTGFFAILLAAGLLTDFLTRNYGLISPYLRWVGVAYMTYLAVVILLSSFFQENHRFVSREGYLGGFVQQFLNPKGILYAITIFTSFAPLLTGSIPLTVGSALLLSTIGFAAVSTWCLAGAGLSRFLTRQAYRFAFNAVMAALLLYSAVSIAIH
jgi:cysteine/O-acetylserine efflux protein